MYTQQFQSSGSCGCSEARVLYTEDGLPCSRNFFPQKGLWVGSIVTDRPGQCYLTWLPHVHLFLETAVLKVTEIFLIELNPQWVQLLKCCALCEQRWQTLHEPLLLLLWQSWYLFSPPLIPSKIPFSDEYSLAELVDYGTPDLSSSIHALSKMTFTFLLFHFLYDFYSNVFYSSIARKSEWAWVILLNISFLLVHWNFFLNLINLSKQLDTPPICSLGHSYFLSGEECL